MRSQVPCHGPPPPAQPRALLYRCGLFRAAPRKQPYLCPIYALWPGCLAEAKEGSAAQVSMGAGEAGRAGASEPWGHKTGVGEAGLPNCLLPGGHVVCSPLTGRHPQSLIQAAGIFPAAQRSSVLFPSSLYTCTCVCVGGECAGVCMCAFIHMEARRQPQGSSPGMSVTPWRQFLTN